MGELFHTKSWFRWPSSHGHPLEADSAVSRVRNLATRRAVRLMHVKYEETQSSPVGTVNGPKIDTLRDSRATIGLVCAKYINPSFQGGNVWIKQPLSPELVYWQRFVEST
ncbi:hypothetical protein TNCV_736511 [Trichonephila clavipes]|nr:hypothetical protein TNCV_736511 [Trichonephila clavipes]